MTTNAIHLPFMIIGGGIGGLTMALGLAETGRSVYVLEQAKEINEVGAGIQLAPNATSILARFGIMEKISKLAVFPKRLVLMDAMTGKQLSALDLDDTFIEKFGHPYIVLHRADLQNALYEACKANDKITILTNHKVEKVEELDDRVLVTLADGTIYSTEMLIGADGLHSKTRKMFIEDKPVPSKYVAYRGTIPMNEITEIANTHMDDMIMWIGPNLHLVQYPVRSGELYNLVIVFKSSRYTEDSDDWGTPDEIEEHFGKCCEPVQHAVSFISRQRRWPMADKDPIYNWVSKRVALLGDAAHPMLQYLAQGGCQAIEDAACLTELLHEYNDNYEKVLSEYQKERVPRATKVQTYARNWGEIAHAIDPVAIQLRNFIMSQRTSQDTSYLDWLYAKRFDKAVK